VYGAFGVGSRRVQTTFETDIRATGECPTLNVPVLRMWNYHVQRGSKQGQVATEAPRQRVGCKLRNGLLSNEQVSRKLTPDAAPPDG
jgi:hypothetical protein